MHRYIASLLVFIPFAAHADGKSLIVGDKVTMAKSEIACRTPETYDRLIELAPDREAFKKQLLISAMSGDCRSFEAGTELVIEENGFLADNFRVRQKGSTESYWIAKGILRN